MIVSLLTAVYVFQLAMLIGDRTMGAEPNITKKSDILLYIFLPGYVFYHAFFKKV